MVALLPTAIPSYSAVANRLNPELARIPKEIERRFPDSHIALSHWGLFYDDVMLHPAQYGITNTTLQCAGRAIYHEDTTPCPDPSAFFYYHHNHPSTAVHKIVGDKLYQEAIHFKESEGVGTP
jgi:phospholipase/lecithinase/hemolysin